MPFVSVDGIRLHYQTHGLDSPPAIVFIHGLGSCGEDWPFQTAAFGQDFRLLTVDLCGHGRSDKPKGRYSVEGFAADVAGLLCDLGEPPVHLVGLSLGGCTALRLAIDRPDRVRSLTLVNAFARLHVPGLRGGARFLLRFLALNFVSMGALAAIVARSLFPGPDQRLLYEAAVARIAGNPKAAYRRSMRAILRFDARDDLPRLRVPTLIVAGDRDATVPLSAKTLLRDRIPGAEFVLIRGSGHATPLDRPEEFNEVVGAFVRRVASRR